MRILYVLSDPTQRFVRAGGGYGTHVREMIAALEEGGHEVDLLDTRRSRGDRGDATGRSMQRRDPDRGRRSPQELLPPRLRAIGRDVTYVANNFRVRRRIGERLRSGGFDLVYERFHHMQWSTVDLARRHHLPVIVEYNAGQHEIVAYQEPGLVSLGTWLERCILARADHVIAVSGVLGRHLVELGVPAERVVVQHNGVDAERFRPAIDGSEVRSRFGVAADEVVVGFVGSLTAWQGIDLLLQAAVALASHRPPVRFLLVGGEPGSPRLEAIRRQVETMGLASAVRLCGRVPFEEVPHYLAAADIAVLPWTAAYTSPIKLFEYMAMGKAVIAADQPAIREVVADGGEGLLTPRDAGALAAAVARLASDPELRGRLGRAARRAVEERHAWHRHVRLLEQLYDGIRTESARP